MQIVYYSKIGLFARTARLDLAGLGPLRLLCALSGIWQSFLALPACSPTKTLSNQLDKTRKLQ